MWSGCHEFLLRERDGVKEGLHRGFAEAPASLVRTVVIVLRYPAVEIGLQLVDAAVDLLAERDSIELVQHGLVESLANSVGLRPFGPGS